MISGTCAQCLRLQSKWYERLARTFDDIEDTRHQDRPLKAWHNHLFKHLTLDDFENKHEYYDKAHELLRNHEFQNNTEKRIWELHCLGFTSPQIEVEIKHMSHAKKQLSIRNIIKELEREFV